MLCFTVTRFLIADSITERVAGMDRYEGFYTYYWCASSGTIWLEVDRFDTEFLYVGSLTAGIGSNDIGLDRNQLGQTHIVSFQRIGPRILLVESNTRYRAESANPDEIKAVRDGFATSVLAGFTVAAEEEGVVLIDMTDFLLRDEHGIRSRLKRSGQGDFRLDDSRSSIFIKQTKNFPDNSEFEVILTFTGENPGRYIYDVTPDPEVVSVRQRHSFIRLPDDGYNPRLFDPRSNFGSMQYMDFAAPIEKAIQKRYIRRHRLRKKDPRADMSEPVEPIIYYVDRGVPEPIRTALVEGASWWNEAFEAIGYRNAFIVRVLPEGADPMDVRYNMINWIHRATRGWSYGSSITDPRTGEIIKGHVALGSQRIRQDFLIAQGLTGYYADGEDNAGRLTEMALARIRQLSCHEVGHTLGLGHNYASSVNNRASVMDYPHPLIRLTEDGRVDLSDAYDTGVGAWDKVSIEYGYQDYPPETDETGTLRAILDHAFEDGLIFLAGRDAGAGSAAPLANVWDNGADPVDELKRVMRVRANALMTFSEARIPEGSPLATLEELLVPVYLFHRYQVEAAASVLGGSFYHHKLKGDVQPYPALVPGSEQRRALNALLETIQPEHLIIDEKLLRLIPPRPPGYAQTRELFPGYTGDTFDPIAAAESAARITVDLIFHPHRASRLIESHARDRSIPALSEVLNTVIDATWKRSSEKTMEAEIQRVVNNLVLEAMIHLAVDPSASGQARAEAYGVLVDLHHWMKKRSRSERDVAQRAHLIYGAARMDGFFSESFPEFRVQPVTVPPGAPIG